MTTKIFLRTVIMLWPVLLFYSCSNQEQITYTKENGIIYFNNTGIHLEINDEMNIKVLYVKDGKKLSIVSEQPEPNEYVVIDGKNITGFKVEKNEITSISNEFGEGKQLRLSGSAKVKTAGGETAVEKVLFIELYNEFPNTAVTYTEYNNHSGIPLKVDKIVNTSYTLDRKLTDASKKSYEFSLFQGRGVEWGVDYSNIKIEEGYSATNFMGIVQAKRDPEGGGIPVLDLWGKEMGMAISHISSKPEFVNMPVEVLNDGRVNYRFEELYTKDYTPIVIQPDGKFTTLKYAVTVHSLDYFDGLRTYAALLNKQGVKTFKDTPGTVPQAYWKTWGYELDFKLKDIYAKLPEFKELGIEMIVLDDGWFSNYGDWEPSTDKEKFPGGREDLIKFVQEMHKQNFKVGIWWCPLIAEPHSDVAKKHPDWFMQMENGQAHMIETPVSYLLCPDYEPVHRFWDEQIEKLYKTFDLDFIYHDWANLIEVPPCYNPAHKHETPLAPYHNMPKQYNLMYEKVQSIKPGFAIEMCECGRPHDPYKMPYYNITNASDATSKEQVVQRLKVEKALNGSKTYFNPGYILPQKPREDWNYDPCKIDECVAMGGYFETYYTELTPEQKKLWVKWLGIYRQEQIYKGEYLNLYDVEFDKPAMHVTKKDSSYYYFGYGPFKGKLELRGLGEGEYRVTDLYTGDLIANVKGPGAEISLATDSNIHLKAEIVK